VITVFATGSRILVAIYFYLGGLLPIDFFHPLLLLPASSGSKGVDKEINKYIYIKGEYGYSATYS
jgi:hypothetical protein